MRVSYALFLAHDAQCYNFFFRKKKMQDLMQRKVFRFNFYLFS